MKILTPDPLVCQIDSDGKKLLQSLLSYPTEYWIQGKFKKERKINTKCMIYGRKPKYYFPAGLLHKVTEHLKSKNIKFTVEEPETLESSWPPSIEGITFRDDQLRSIKAAVDLQRGVLKLPTGTGKTVVASGIISCFDGYNVLFLVHTKSLLYQTADELEKFLKEPIGLIGDGHKNTNERITVAITKSFITMDPDFTLDTYDMVIVDECHHVSSFDGMHAKCLNSILAPMRIGLTATMPDKDAQKAALEGLIGPVIDTLSLKEGNKLGILAKPKIRIVKVPYSHNIRGEKKYPDVYKRGIVTYKARNELIASLVQEEAKLGHTVLINITNLEHGDYISDKLTDAGIDHEFVEGMTDGQAREEIKKLLNDGHIQCVISSKAWREGVNIPTLNTVINAAGGKSEIGTLQFIGRGLRKTEDKDVVTIIDLFDPSHPYLISHFGERISLYCENGWI